MTRKTKLHEIRDYVIIALAMIEGSIGLNIFLLPNHITMGGVGAVSYTHLDVYKRQSWCRRNRRI